MTITDEQAKQVKEHLLKQINNFPEDKRTQIKEQIESMTTEQVENFVRQNNLTHLGGECIFCSIIAGNTPSFQILENNENIAILELNPLSRGHTLVVPKSHDEGIKDSSRNLAELVEKKLRERLNPKDIKINEIKIMEHPLLEVIPLYGNETEIKKATETELEQTQEFLTKEPEIEEEKEPSLPTAEPLQKLKVRIP